MFWALIAVGFGAGVLALLEPAGADTNRWAIRATAILPVCFWCVGWPIALTRRLYVVGNHFQWTGGCVGCLLHIAVAFHLGHGWSHETAWEHTRQVGGYGEGVYVNYAFALVWLFDVVWLWVAVQSYKARPWWLKWPIHGFLAFVVFNAAVVFGGWEARSYFAIFFTTTLLVVLYDATTHPAIADDSGK